MNPFNKAADFSDAKTFLPQHQVLQGDAERLIYNPSLLRDKQLPDAHWGQLKLCLSLIQFITTTIKPSDRQVRIVYAGAASGRGTSIVATLFPWIHFDLFDKNNFFDTLEHLTNVSIIKDYFTDDCAVIYSQLGNESFVEGHNKRSQLKSDTGIRRPKVIASEDIYFVSDIRRNSRNNFIDALQNTSSELYQEFLSRRDHSVGIDEAKRSFIDDKIEKSVMTDMIMQQNWVQIINPIACQLKCRMPYAIKSNPKFFSYLDGVIFFQPFVGMKSSETRLVCVRSEGGFATKDYDVLAYEQVLFAHNMGRINDKYRNILTGNVEHYIETELINTYDCTCAAFILKECYRSIHGYDLNSAQLASFYIGIVTKLNYTVNPDELTSGQGVLAKLYRNEIKISGISADKETYTVTSTTSRIGSALNKESEKPFKISTIRVNFPL